MAQYLEKPTVVPLAGCDALEDARVLRAAMKGFGTDEKPIIEVLCHRSNLQRQQISVAYKNEFGRDLTKDLKSELGGKFEQVILGLMLPVAEYLAVELHDAMSKLGTDEDVLVEVLCTRTNEEIRQINEAFLKKYGKTVEHEITKETSGDFRRLLVLMVTGVRDERAVNPSLVEEMVQQLYNAGEGKLGTDEETFNSILAHQSFAQLRLVFEEYKKLTGRTLEEAIDAELSGELHDGLLAVVKSVQSRPTYFATKLKKAMEGMGTEDSSVIRIIVSRAEQDLGNIKEEFERLYGKTLESALTDETSGDYRNALLELLGPR